jgi:hypothetical protein
MKKRLNIYKAGLLAIILAVGMYGCSEDLMDRINEDTNHTKDVPAKFTIADVITSTAFYNVGGDMNTYMSVYIEHEVGTHNQLYRAEQRDAEPSSASTFNNVWNNLYGSLKNARMVKARCSEGGLQEGNKVTKGIAEVLIALNSAIITDMYGDVPYSEASQPLMLPDIFNPRIDKQEDIYKAILDELDEAIADLQGTDAHTSGGVGSYDLLYGGDKTLWTKLAYGLKARYTMRLLHRSTDRQGDLQKVIDYVDRSFVSASEQAAFNIYGPANLNPLFDFQWSRDGLAASKSMFDRLAEREDPRLRRAFVNADWEQITGEDDESLNLAPNGENNEVQYYYNTSVFVFSQTASTQLLSYHEIQFLKAEALCRLNRADDARPVLKEAFLSAVANLETSVEAAMTAPTILSYGGLAETTDAISMAEAEQYFDDTIDPLFTSNPLQETMIQKYIAFFGASGESPEAYNDYRRLKALGEDFIELENPGRFPLRAPYGVSDVTANPNVESIFGDGQYIYTENVWWAGGSR